MGLITLDPALKYFHDIHDSTMDTVEFQDQRRTQETYRLLPVNSKFAKQLTELDLCPVRGGE